MQETNPTANRILRSWNFEPRKQQLLQILFWETKFSSTDLSCPSDCGCCCFVYKSANNDENPPTGGQPTGMTRSRVRAILADGYSGSRFLTHGLPKSRSFTTSFSKARHRYNSPSGAGSGTLLPLGLLLDSTLFPTRVSPRMRSNCRSISQLGSRFGFCGLASAELNLGVSNANYHVVEESSLDDLQCYAVSEDAGKSISSSVDTDIKEPKGKRVRKKSIVEFNKIDVDLLPTVILVGRPNVGKSALFNRLIRRREALVYNTPGDHVTRDIREGVAKLGDLRFRVLDSAGLETAASSGSILDRTAEMTGNVLEQSQFAVFLIDVRDGLQPMDLEVGKWLRKHASGLTIVLAMNKSESLDDQSGLLTAAVGEAHKLGYGDPIAISAETGLGMVDLYEALRPLLEEYMLRVLNDKASLINSQSEVEDSKLPLQLAIVGRPNVGKSTLLNALLQQDRVLVGPEAGLTRDSVRAQFQYKERTIYLVDTAGWLQRTKQEKGPSSLSVMQSRKSIMRAHVIALVLDGEEIAKASSSIKHAEVVIARRAVEEGRGLVVIVNKMDLLQGTHLFEKVIKAVPEEIQKVIPQVTGIPVVFISALEGRGRIGVMRQVVDTYEKWCLRLSTARLNRWLRKVMSRHSWKDQAAQPKIKYFTQVKARPPTFVAFVSGKTRLSDTDIRFLTKSLKEDFDMGGIPIRIMQRTIPRRETDGNKNSQSPGRVPQKITSDKRNVSI